MNAISFSPLIATKVSIVDKGFEKGVIKLGSDIWRYNVTIGLKEMSKLLLKLFMMVFGLTAFCILGCILSFSITMHENSMSVGLNSNPNLSKLSCMNSEITFPVVLGFNSLYKEFRSTAKLFFLDEDDSSPNLTLKTDFGISIENYFYKNTKPGVSMIDLFSYVLVMVTPMSKNLLREG